MFYPCLRNNLLPICPVRTDLKLAPREEHKSEHLRGELMAASILRGVNRSGRPLKAEIAAVASVVNDHQLISMVLRRCSIRAPTGGSAPRLSSAPDGTPFLLRPFLKPSEAVQLDASLHLTRHVRGNGLTGPTPTSVANC